MTIGLLALVLVVCGARGDEAMPATPVTAGNCCMRRQHEQQAGKIWLDGVVQRLLSLGEMCKTALFNDETCPNAATPRQYQVEAKLICQKGAQEQVVCSPKFIMSSGQPAFSVLNGKPTWGFRTCGLQLAIKHLDRNCVQVDMEISYCGLEPVDIGNGAQAIPFGVSKTQSKIPLGQPTKVPFRNIAGSDAVWLELRVAEVDG